MLRFYLLKTLKYVSSLIANKAKTNMCLVWIKVFIVRTILCVTVQICTTHTTIIYLFYIIIYLLYCLLFLSHNYSLDLHDEELQTTTVFCTRNFTQGSLNSLLTLACLCLAYFYLLLFSLMKVSEVKRSGFRFLRNTLQLHCCCVRILVYPLLLLVYLCN